MLRSVLSFALVGLISWPAIAQEVTPAQISQAARVAGQLSQMRPSEAPRDLRSSPFLPSPAPEQVTSVCLSASPVPCQGRLSQDPAMAFCDVDQTSFSHCLAQYRNQLVRSPHHQPPATLAYQVTWREPDGSSVSEVVLMATDHEEVVDQKGLSLTLTSLGVAPSAARLRYVWGQQTGEIPLAVGETVTLPETSGKTITVIRLS